MNSERIRALLAELDKELKSTGEIDDETRELLSSLNDELDENGVLPTTTFVFDVSDPGNPSNVGTSPMTMVSVRPRTKPVTIGLDRNSASHGIRNTPATTSATPATMARAEVMATASWGLSREMSATSEPDTIATVEAGPTISCGDDPRTP